MTDIFEAMEGKIDLNKAVITNQLAHELNIGPGDKLTIVVGAQIMEMEISGVAYDIIQVAVYTTRENLADFTPVENCTGVYIKLTNPSKSEEYAQGLRENPMVQKVALKQDIIDSFTELLDQAGGMLYFFFFISFLFCLFTRYTRPLFSSGSYTNQRSK